MKKYILLFVFFIGFVHTSWGQAIGSWKAYPALQICTYNVPTKNKIYALCNGNLFSYNTEDTEVYVYDNLNGLHDTSIKFIRYNETTDKLVVVYENGNVDIIYPDESVSNLKQLKDKNYSNLVINNLSIKGKKAYICTNFGIVTLNTEEEIFENTYDIGMNILCCTQDDNYIYASGPAGLYRGAFSQNLLDKSNWSKVNGGAFHDMTFFKGELIGQNKHSGLFKVNGNGSVQIEKGLSNFFFYNEDIMLMEYAGKIIRYTSLAERKTFDIEDKIDFLSYRKGAYWASRNINGLQPYTLKEEKFIAQQSSIQPNSPVRDYFCNMHYDGNRLLVAGGDLNYTGKVREGTVMYYENDKWYNFSEENITNQTNLRYINTTSVAQDPNDPTHHYVSSAGQGLYEFKDLKFVKKYDYTNSPLRTLLPVQAQPMDYIRCDALQYDVDGNLWIANNQVDSVLIVLKVDNTWLKFYFSELERSPNITHILFDEKNRVWVNSKRLDWGGVFFLDHNGTIDDTSDDIHFIRRTIINQDGIRYEPYYFNCIEQDLNEQFWVGTSSGLFIIENPEKFTDDNFTFTQIKISREDGSEYADYLLNGIDITAIAVDAANRKWIGTSYNGIYLISEDGQEMLQHFTTENSPLTSNVIQSITVNPQTGEVMIGTSTGLMSYMSDANTPSEELDKDNVRVYPNPVKPEYNGLITVDGLTYNAEVKITTITGQLVYSGHANGGLFTWNGKTKTGRRVASGVYNIISTNQEGKKAIVNRITFIR